MKSKIIFLVILLFAITLVGQAQTRKEKNEFIIQKLDLVKIQKKHYEDRISFLNLAVSGKDTIRVNEIEKMITEKYVFEELNSVFDTLFSDIELNDLYVYCHSTSLEKIFYPKMLKFHFYLNTPLDQELLAILNRHMVYEK